MAFNPQRFTRVSLADNTGALTLQDSTVVNGPAFYTYATASDSVATVSAANYFASDYTLWDLQVADVIMCICSDANTFLEVTAIDSDAGTVSTTAFTPSGTVNTANIVDGAVTGPKLANPLSGVAGGYAFSTTTSSATPGTVRSLKGLMIGTGTPITSGNLVGVRGEVDYVSASGGFMYGVQGKLIPTGTISGSSWNAGVFGQLDISAATVNAGQMAPIWGDYGASSGTLTDQTGLYGIAMTNTTAVVTAAQIYLYGGASALMKLETNAGLSGVTYFINAGTTAGSWGNATPPTPSKVLKITVDGTAYYLPLVAQNT